MPKNDAHTLRIYCICGQKMKVLPEMYGQPGKCINCRQKLRVPQADEIPDGVTEIHLKEHPEFLRKIKGQNKSGSEHAEASYPESFTELDVDGAAPHRPDHPLDILEPLRALVSLEYRLKHKRSLIKGEVSKTHYTPEQLDHYLDEVHAAREELDETLRRHLLDTRIARTAAEEQLLEAARDVRSGQLEIRDYIELYVRLGWRRDCLARREANLRGWLAVKTPAGIGGYERLPIDQLPDRLEKPPFSDQLEEPQPLPDYWINKLRDYLSRRDQWLTKKKGIEDVDAETNEIEHRRSEVKSMLSLAKANIAFCRERLEQHQRDCAAHLALVEGQLDLLRGRQLLGDVKKKEFRIREGELQQIKHRIIQTDELLKRALKAKSSDDVPRPHGTRLSRIRSVHGLQKKQPYRPGKNILLAGLLAVLIVSAAALGVILGVTDFGSALSDYYPQVTRPEPSLPETPVTPPDPAPVPVDEDEPEEPIDEEAVEPEPVEEDPIEDAPVPEEEPPDYEIPFPMPEPEARDEVKAELRGVLRMPDRPPRFSIHVHMPDGEIRSRSVSIGAPIYRMWYVAEYNPAEQTVTLSDDESFVILRRGDPQVLEVED